MIIYGLTDPRNKQLRYVGFTSKTLEERLRTHILAARRRSTKNSCWIKSLLKNGLKPEIFKIQDTDKDNWQEDEQFYIAYFKYIGCKLLNMTIGGEVSPIKGSESFSKKHRMNLAMAARKLTDEQAQSVYEKYWAWGFTQVDLAKMFNVHYTTIMKIVNGKNRWQYASGIEKSESKSTGKRSLTGEQVEEIKNLHRDGNITITKLSEIYEISSSTISNIVNGKSYKMLIK